MPFIIELLDAETGKSSYIARGEWTEFCLRSIADALEFNTMEAVEAAFQSDDFTKRSEWADGLSSPPAIPWTGLGICNYKPKGRGRYVVYEVARTPVKIVEVREELRWEK